MHRSTLLALCSVSTILIGGNACLFAQEYDFPYLTKLGRIAGLGHTRGGYHAAANGQLPIVKRNHPACSYSSGRLLYPYHPGYQPFRVRPTAAGQPTSPLANQGVPTPSAEEPETIQPPTPKVPPPEWLERYLDERATDEVPRRPTPQSRRSGVSQLPPPQTSSSGDDLRASPFKLDGESSPSDRQPAGNDNLLNDEDVLDEEDLLLLDDGSLSRRPQPRIQTPTVRQPVNRYRQVWMQHRAIR